MVYSKQIKLILGPLLAAVIYFGFDLMPGSPMVTKMAAVTVWMAIWWLTEVVHLAVTAFIPYPASARIFGDLLDAEDCDERIVGRY
jgi:di/tricarboxylate transporter